MTAVLCQACKTTSILAPDDFKCPKCGAKLRETLAEMERTIALAQTAHTVKRARLWLLLAAALNLAVTLLFVYLPLAADWARVADSVKISVYASAAIGALLFVLWVWARVQPLPATLLALIVYGTLTLVAIVTSPASLFSVFSIFRALVLVSLATGVSAAVKHRRLVRSQPSLAA